jgi:hypothetical protein
MVVLRVHAMWTCRQVMVVVNDIHVDRVLFSMEAAAVLVLVVIFAVFVQVMMACLVVSRGDTITRGLEVTGVWTSWPDHACVGQALDAPPEIVFPLADLVLLVDDSSTCANIEHKQDDTNDYDNHNWDPFAFLEV